MKKLLLLAALVGGLSLFASTKTAEAGYGPGYGGFNNGYRSSAGFGGYRNQNFGHMHSHNQFNSGFRSNWNLRYTYPGTCLHDSYMFPSYVPAYVPAYGGCTY